LSQGSARTSSSVVPGPVSNLEAFRVAFGLGDEAPIMRPRQQRIEIW
jgi:predicted metalloendopeptidase